VSHCLFGRSERYDENDAKMSHGVARLRAGLHTHRVRKCADAIGTVLVP